MSFYPYPPPSTPFRSFTPPSPQTFFQPPRVHSYVPIQQYQQTYAFPINNPIPQNYTHQTHFYPQNPIRGQTLNNFYNYQPNYVPPRQSLPTPTRVPFQNQPINTNKVLPSNYSNYVNNPKINLKNTMPPQFSSPQRPISDSKIYFASPQKSILKPMGAPKEKASLKENVKIDFKPTEVKTKNPVKENKNGKTVEKKHRVFSSIKKIEEVLREEEVSRLENSQKSPKLEDPIINQNFPIIMDETKNPVLLTEKEIEITPSN